VAQLAGFLSGAVQLSLFAVVMLVAAFFVFRNNESGEDNFSDGSTRRLLRAGDEAATPAEARRATFTGAGRRPYGLASTNEPLTH